MTKSTFISQLKVCFIVWHQTARTSSCHPICGFLTSRL